MSRRVGSVQGIGLRGWSKASVVYLWVLCNLIFK
jgi:hypothetical protein